MPYADAGPTVIPQSIDDDNAALCTDAYPTGYQGAEMAQINRGDSVVVFGAGPVGLFAARCAWFFGAGRVLIVDEYDYRLRDRALAARAARQLTVLRYLVSGPRNPGPHPLLCFLHGYDEAAPEPMEVALRRHGPLHAGNPKWIQEQFVILAPQLPRAGDDWQRFGGDVAELVRRIAEEHPTDARRMYLTGFSFGGNGVFALAEGAHPWAALWAVDPTRIPRHTIETPVWLSFGEAARWRKADYIRALHLAPAPAGKRVYTDSGDDHVGSARHAYSHLAAYEWLLQQRKP